ncbi:carbohydrate ABC transporter permease [Butyrivibrio sp. MC2013]|uniref:carbohydrate ABC transporter permease n=1 Tax=Butyrivibrio sp. MC2013 TaxID=1280686 RepID=UPI00041A2ACC|nr:sugar ABC transporter permease [Butyrivibrio sp. MC2013]
MDFTISRHKDIDTSPKTAMRSKSRFRRKDVFGWLLILPSLILFTFYIWEPLLENIRLSFCSAKLYTVTGFAGLDNYKAVIGDVDFMAAFRNTFSYTFWSLVIGFLVPIIMAVLISETVHGKSLFRVGVYFPNIMPTLATIWVWSYFFMPGDTGVLNILLGKLGIAPSQWLNNAHFTIPLIIITMTWKSAGSTALIYMANISGISPDLYEAATIDGASIWQRVAHITVPSIFSIARTMLILQVISVFQIMYEPMIFKNGGPGNASISLMMLMYRYLTRDYNVPKAAALSVLVSIFLVVLSIVYMSLTRDKEDKR